MKQLKWTLAYICSFSNILIHKQRDMQKDQLLSKRGRPRWATQDKHLLKGMFHQYEIVIKQMNGYVRPPQRGVAKLQQGRGGGRTAPDLCSAYLYLYSMQFLLGYWTASAPVTWCRQRDPTSGRIHQHKNSQFKRDCLTRWIWLLMPCMVSSRSKQGTGQLFKFFRCFYNAKRLFLAVNARLHKLSNVSGEYLIQVLVWQISSSIGPCFPLSGGLCKFYAYVGGKHQYSANHFQCNTSTFINEHLYSTWDQQ